MSDQADRPRGMSWTLKGLDTQPLLLLCLGLLFSVAAFLVTASGPGFVLSAAGGGCLGAALLIAGHGVWRRRRAAAGLRQAGALIATDPSPVFVTDARGRIRRQNEAAETRFGAKPGQSVVQAVGRALPNAAAVVARHAAAVEKEGAARETVHTPRGAIRLVACKVEAGVLWRIEDAPQDGRIGSGIGLPMMLVSHADAVISMNDAMRDLIGTTPRTLRDVFPADALVPGRRTKLRTQHETIEVVPIILPTRDGRREVYAVPGLAEPPAASVAARAFEALPVALLHLGDDGRILASNRQAQTLLGIDADEEGDLSGLVEGLGRPVREWVADTLAERIPARSEVVRARRRGNECFLQISLSRIADASGPSLLVVLHDATELKTLEQQFVQSQKMQAVGELAGGVAHDFNNLLTAITGHCDLLLLRHDQGDPDYGDLVQINQNANRAASLVGQLLAFSRQQTLQLDVVDLRDTMGELMHLLNRLVGERIALKLSHDPGLLPIRVDRRQLDQVIMNLVVNARDAMAEGGEIEVATRVERLREGLKRDNVEVPAGSYVKITVRDEGHGIPPAKLGRIFEPFFTTKEVGKGTGLGLSMAYGIIKQSGGYIFVDSEVGVGTTFTILIPVYDVPASEERGRPLPSVPAAAAAPAPVEARPDRGGPPVVLLVEDEAPVRAFASRALQLRGYKVFEASDAEDALRTLRQGGVRFDLFVTDVIMPGMDGPTWVREALREHPGTGVVFVSGYSEEDIGALSADIPNSVFLPKPFSLSDLTDTVARQLH